MLVCICVLSWQTLTAHGLWASWVKHPALVTCCWNWPGPRRITKETDHTSAPSGWKESVREARNVPTGGHRIVFFFFFKLFQRSKLVYKSVFFSLYTGMRSPQILMTLLLTRTLRTVTMASMILWLTSSWNGPPLCLDWIPQTTNPSAPSTLVDWAIPSQMAISSKDF